VLRVNASRNPRAFVETQGGGEGKGGGYQASISSRYVRNSFSFLDMLPFCVIVEAVFRLFLAFVQNTTDDRRGKRKSVT
jgi:hypothetical protein